MILPDHKLREWAQQHLTPYDADCINPASIDLRLDRRFIDLESGNEIHVEQITIKPGAALLASTIEYIEMPADCAGVLYLKSSMARAGLDHALAGFVDPGFKGTLTMELHSHRPVTLQASQRVIQLVLYRLESAAERPYQGRYQHQVGPTEAR